MLVAYEVSKSLIPQLAPVVAKIERHDRDLAEQLRRATSSVLLNLGEGARSQKGNKHKHYSLAHGSAGEVRAALDVAIARHARSLELDPRARQAPDTTSRNR